MFHRYSMFALFCLCLSSGNPARAQQARLLSSGVVSSDGGRHEWYTVVADPENPNNLITCGMMWNAQDNANYGFVYSSQDAGRIWHLAFEDKNSKHVSEESCAFGVHGVAYFVADASKVDPLGYADHERGTTRIWVSHDAGETWSLGMTWRWTDCSSSAVDRSPGPNQNRLYIFFNTGRTQLLNLPLDEEHAGNSVGLISYKDGDQTVAGPIFNPEMSKQLYRGAYTHQNLILKDGSLLTLFWSRRLLVQPNAHRNPIERIFAAQHTDPQRRSLSDPGIIQRWLEPPGHNGMECNSYTNAPATYDSSTNTVYVAYLDGTSAQCKLMLTTSTDDGQTWTPGRPWIETQGPEANPDDAIKHTYYSLALARNEQGVLALLWRNADTSNCWYFATSTDGGHVYSHPMQLSSCSPDIDNSTHHIADAYLGFWGQHQADESKPTDDAPLEITNSYNFGENHLSGIAVSSDGVFHPVWIASENGIGQLRTAAIAVLKPLDGNAPEQARTDGWLYKTNEVKFLYGGSQHYDSARGVLTESIVVRNSGTETLKAPLRLEIDSSSQLGLIYPLDVTTEGSGHNIAQYLNISQYVSGDGLNPGASSAPIPLGFHFEPYNDPGLGDDNRLAQVSIRLLVKKTE